MTGAELLELAQAKIRSGAIRAWVLDAHNLSIWTRIADSEARKGTSPETLADFIVLTSMRMPCGD